MNKQADTLSIRLTEIARHLSQETGDEWTAVLAEDGWSGRLVRPDKKVHIDVSMRSHQPADRGKMRLSFGLPDFEDLDLKNQLISWLSDHLDTKARMNPSRSPQSLTKDVMRRVLPEIEHTERRLEELLERYENRKATDARIASRVEAAFGAPLTPALSPDKLSLHANLPDEMHLEVATRKRSSIIELRITGPASEAYYSLLEYLGAAGG